MYVFIAIIFCILYLQGVKSATVNRDDLNIVESCFSATLSEAAYVTSSCGDDGMLHCLEDTNFTPRLVCFSWKWIKAGMCPYFNTYQGNLDERKCNESLGECPTNTIKSYLSLSYQGCYQRRKPQETTTLGTTQQMLGLKSSDQQVVYLLMNEEHFKRLRSDSYSTAVATLILLSVLSVLVFVLIITKNPRIIRKIREKRVFTQRSSCSLPTSEFQKNKLAISNAFNKK